MTAGISLVLASAASALPRQSEKAQEKLAKYEKTGETISCINLRFVRSTDILDDYSMLVEANGELYLTEMNGRCSGLAHQRRYIHESPQGQMCRGDIIRVIDAFGMPSGACSLGDFEKLVEIETDE